MAATDPERVGMIGLLDTNVLLYLLGGKLAEPLPSGGFGISAISEMELLAWPSLSREEEAGIEDFLETVTIYELTPSIKKIAVRLRREQNLKLPDAMFARLRSTTNYRCGRTTIGSRESQAWSAEL